MYIILIYENNLEVFYWQARFSLKYNFFLIGRWLYLVTKRQKNLLFYQEKVFIIEQTLKNCISTLESFCNYYFFHFGNEAIKSQVPCDTNAHTSVLTSVLQDLMDSIFFYLILRIPYKFSIRFASGQFAEQLSPSPCVWGRARSNWKMNSLSPILSSTDGIKEWFRTSR